MVGHEARRRWLTCGVVGRATLLPAVAGAQRPHDPYIPGPNPTELKGYCPGFTAIVTFSQFNQYIIQDTTNPVTGVGTLRITGHARATLTNATTGKSVTYNISGPATVVINPDLVQRQRRGPEPIVDHTGELGEFPGRPDDQLHDGSRKLCGRRYGPDDFVQPRRRHAPDRCMRSPSVLSVVRAIAVGPAVATRIAVRASGSRVSRYWVRRLRERVLATGRCPLGSAYTLHGGPNSCRCSGRAIRQRPLSQFRRPLTLETSQLVGRWTDALLLSPARGSPRLGAKCRYARHGAARRGRLGTRSGLMAVPGVFELGNPVVCGRRAVSPWSRFALRSGRARGRPRLPHIEVPDRRR